MMVPARQTQRITWSFVGNVLSALWSLVIALLAARRMASDDFGRLALLLSATVVWSTMVASAMGQTGTRLFAEFRQRDPARLRPVVAMLTAATTAVSLGAALVFLLGGRHTLGLVLGEGAPGDSLFLVAWVLFGTGIGAFQQGLLAGAGDFPGIASVHALRLLVGAGSILLLPATLNGAVAALAFSTLAGVILAQWHWTRLHPEPTIMLPRAQWWPETPLLWSFALPSWLAGTMFVVAAWAGNVLLSHQQDGLVQVGWFGAASQWGRSLLLFAPAAFTAPLLVSMSAAWGSSSPGEVRRITRQGTLWCTAAALPAALLVLLLAPALMRLYGPEFSPAVPVVRILLVSTAIAAATLVPNLALTAAGKLWPVAWVTAVWAAVFVGAAAMWVSDGAVGLARAYVLAYAAQCGLTLAVLRRHQLL